LKSKEVFAITWLLCVMVPFIFINDMLFFWFFLIYIFVDDVPHGFCLVRGIY